MLQVVLIRLKLMESDKHGATRLTPEVDGVPAVPELRPITLLNCDYKGFVVNYMDARSD